MGCSVRSFTFTHLSYVTPFLLLFSADHIKYHGQVPRLFRTAYDGGGTWHSGVGGGAIADLTSKAVHGDMLVCQLNN